MLIIGHVTEAWYVGSGTPSRQKYIVGATIREEWLENYCKGQEEKQNLNEELKKCPKNSETSQSNLKSRVPESICTSQLFLMQGKTGANGGPKGCKI